MSMLRDLKEIKKEDPNKLLEMKTTPDGINRE